MRRRRPLSQTCLTKLYKRSRSRSSTKRLKRGKPFSSRPRRPRSRWTTRSCTTCPTAQSSTPRPRSSTTRASTSSPSASRCVRHAVSAPPPVREHTRRHCRGSVPRKLTDCGTGAPGTALWNLQDRAAAHVEAPFHDRPQELHGAHARAAGQLPRRPGSPASHFRREPLPFLVEAWSGTREASRHCTGAPGFLQVRPRALHASTASRTLCVV